MSSQQHSRGKLTLELVDRQPSGWVKEETKGTANEVRLDAPSTYFLPPISKVKDPKDGSYKTIRHIEGCPYLDIDEQKAKGWSPNPDRDSIVFINGVLLVADDGLDKSRYAYLKACEYNANNPDRPDNADKIFKVIEKEKAAEQYMAAMDSRFEAYKLLGELRSKAGSSGYEYDTEKIDFMCELHGIGGLDTDIEKLAKLQMLAEANPSKFVDSVLNKRSAIKVAINDAVKFSVLSLDGNHASFMGDGGKNILEFSSKKKAEKIEELSDFFLLPRGKADYEQMVIATTAAKEKELAIA